MLRRCRARYTPDANSNFAGNGQRSFSYDSASSLGEVQISQNAEAAKGCCLHNALGQRHIAKAGGS